MEELKDQELHDDSANTPSELQYTVINIVLTGFEDPITIVSSGKSKNSKFFEYHQQSIRIYPIFWKEMQRTLRFGNGGSSYYNKRRDKR